MINYNILKIQFFDSIPMLQYDTYFTDINNSEQDVLTKINLYYIIYSYRLTKASSQTFVLLVLKVVLRTTMMIQYNYIIL